MGLRKTLIFAAALLAARPFLALFRQKQKGFFEAVVVFGVLQIWMLFVALFLADTPLLSLSEWKGQWLPTGLSFVIGAGIAYLLMSAQLGKPYSAVCLVVAIPITWFVIVYSAIVVQDSIASHTFLTRHLGMTDHPSNVGYLFALLEPILIADLLSRAIKREPLLALPVWLPLMVLALGVFALVAASSRNGLLMMLLAFVFGAAILLYELRKTYPPKRIMAVFLLALTLLAGYVFISLKTDTRWQNFIQTVPIAWDIDRHTAWIEAQDANVTQLIDGKSVDTSTYYRIAWAHEGWRMLFAHPWGMEISRHTFNKLEQEKFGKVGMAHAHNSWIDFGLNVGVAGLILWGAFLFLLAKKGWDAWTSKGEILGLALTMVVLMFAVRGFVDSIFRDHIVGQFMLVAGLLFGALSYQQNNLMKNNAAEQ